MLCYKDKTFCAAICMNVECPDKITIDVINGSIEAGLDLSMDDFKDTCGTYQAPTKKFFEQGRVYVERKYQVLPKVGIHSSD